MAYNNHSNFSVFFLTKRGMGHYVSMGLCVAEYETLKHNICWLIIPDYPLPPPPSFPASVIVSKICGRSRTINWSNGCQYIDIPDGHIKRCYCQDDLCNSGYERSHSGYQQTASWFTCTLAVLVSLWWHWHPTTAIPATTRTICFEVGSPLGCLMLSLTAAGLRGGSVFLVGRSWVLIWAIFIMHLCFTDGLVC